MTEEQINDLSINDDDVVDPWNVAGKSQTGIDYDKLISKFITLYHQSYVLVLCLCSFT